LILPTTFDQPGLQKSIPEQGSKKNGQRGLIKYDTNLYIKQKLNHMIGYSFLACTKESKQAAKETGKKFLHTNLDVTRVEISLVPVKWGHFRSCHV